MAEIRINDIDESEIDTVLAEDIDFSGVVTFRKPLMIKGRFSGEIRVSGDLYVGERAEVEAKIEADLVSAKGQIRGDIVARRRLELFSTARVDGDVTTPDLVMESGCKLNGYCDMRGPQAASVGKAAAVKEVGRDGRREREVSKDVRP